MLDAMEAGLQEKTPPGGDGSWTDMNLISLLLDLNIYHVGMRSCLSA